MEDRMTMFMKDRAEKRKDKTPEIRKVEALEDIADTLFRISAELARMRAQPDLKR